MQLSDFDYPLPDELIARQPPPERDGARLLLVHREGPFEHAMFRDLPRLLAPGDLLVLNDARVIKARLKGRKADTGGEVEILLDRPLDARRWLALGNASKGFKEGQRLELAGSAVVVTAVGEGGRLTVDFGSVDALGLAQAHGELPLPPYLGRAPEAADAERYQTVFAREPGAVAAPTAGLHFSERTFEALKAAGVQVAFLTLQVGPGTFLPVRSEDIAAHRMLEERFAISPALAEAFGETRRRRGRVVAVGTTVTRALESAVDGAGALVAGEGLTELFIRPGHRFRAVDGLLTNFHLPRSTLLMLVSALAGRERVLSAYAEAVAHRYRFFSYGDCCLFFGGSWG
jgi:S-adenosylmethionine:tRNA ribosyltransferase-isomerase